MQCFIGCILVVRAASSTVLRYALTGSIVLSNSIAPVLLILVDC